MLYIQSVFPCVKNKSLQFNNNDFEDMLIIFRVTVLFSLHIYKFVADLLPSNRNDDR